MRKIGLLTTLTLGIMMVFSTAAMAAAPAIHFDSPTNQVVHSSYSKTSDACASCHSPHNALNGERNLLKFADVSSACMACHDGTVTTTYNVVQGTHNGVPNSAGKFGVATATRTSDPGLSKHVVSAGLTTSVAPGGNSDSAAVDNNGAWGTEFNCVACHVPHGDSGNARALNPNVNGIAVGNGVALAKAKGELLTTTDNLTYQAKNTAWMGGHSYPVVVYVNDVVVTTGFTVDSVNGRIVFAAAQTLPVKAAYYAGLIVKMDIANKMTANETVKYQSGLNQFCGACHTDYNNVGKTGTNGISTGGAYDDLIGDYSKAYRHSVGITRTATAADPLFNDPNGLNASYPGLVFEKSAVKSGVLAATVNCLTCHYAHGTSDSFIEANLAKQLGPVNVFNGNNATGSKLLQTYDNTRSSALKRLPNMGVCQACHNKV